jgi:hypothetical protein
MGVCAKGLFLCVVGFFWSLQLIRLRLGDDFYAGKIQHRR